jgi:peptide/nickel transport system substrate-binding protein
MEKKSKRRMSRRDFLKYSGVAAAAGVLSGVSSRRGLAKDPPRELVVAISGDPGHLDPRVEAGGIGFSTFCHMFEHGVFRDKDCKPFPQLAEKWTWVSPTVLRWNLRKGIKFHNGEEFTAEAVKLSIGEIIAPHSRYPFKDGLSAIKNFKIHDPYTIDMILEKPYVSLIGVLADGFIISPRALRELGNKFSTNPVGTGQMKFVEYRPGQHVVMEANQNYWGKKSNFSGLRMRFVPETGTRVAALEVGEVMMINNVPPDQLPRLRAHPNIDVLVYPSTRVMFSTIRCDRKPFDDKRVRQAMNYAVDKEAITKGLLSGMAPISRAPVSRMVPAHHPNLTQYNYDPERAKKLLAEAGATGATFNFASSNGRYLMDRQVGEAIAGYLSAVGLNVKFENPPWGNLVAEVTRFEKCRYDGYLFGYATFTNHPDFLMRDHFYSKSVKRTLYSNPEVDRLLEQGMQEFNEQKMMALYYRAEEIVWDEAPWIFLYEQPTINAKSKKLRWAAERLDEFFLFHDASFVEG